MSNHFARMAAEDRHLLSRFQQELTGIAKGLLADGILNDKELVFLKQWFEERDLIAYNFPGDIVYEGLCDLMIDEVIDENKRDSFVTMLEELIGGNFEVAEGAPPAPITLPVEQVDNIEFENKLFCFTGIFLFKDAGKDKGPLREATRKAGGTPHSNVVKKLNYLVIGAKPHPRWSHGNYGNKIDKAVRYRNEGCDLIIIDEATWVSHLPTRCR